MSARRRRVFSETVRSLDELLARTPEQLGDAGIAEERYMYNPYGEVARPESDGGANGGGRCGRAGEILYSGYRTDPEMGLHQVRFRFYHPTLGRWVTRDPAASLSSECSYQYADGQPSNALDPFGLSAVVFRQDANAKLYNPAHSGITRFSVLTDTAINNVSSSPAPEPDSKCFVCDFTPEAVIHVRLREGIKTEAQVLEQVNQKNFANKASRMRDAVYIDKQKQEYFLYPNSRDVITLESAQAHEQVHVNQRQGVIRDAWNTVEADVVSKIRVADPQECRDLIPQVLAAWREAIAKIDVARYDANDPQKFKQATEPDAYEAMKKVLQGTATRIVEIARERGWRR